MPIPGEGSWTLFGVVKKPIAAFRGERGLTVTYASNKTAVLLPRSNS